MQSPDAGGAPNGFRPDIQVLRAVAVAMVVLFHAHVRFLQGGFVGVDVFFVISGYLIGGHLIREREGTGRIRLLPFWARRIRRLLPAALLVLVVTLIAAKLLVYPLSMLSIADDGRATTLYAANVQFATSGVSYLADQAPSPFQQFWSLSLEEQFYVFWPIFLMSIYGIGRSRLRTVRAAAISLAALVSFLLCIALTAWLQPIGFYLLPTRVWEFAAGTAIALFATRLRMIPRNLGPVLAVSGLAAILLSAITFSATLLFPGFYAVLPVLGTALVLAGGGVATPAWLGRIWNLRILQFLGVISYSLYLWHWPLLVLPTYGTNRSLPVLATVGLVALAVLLAWLTYRFVEVPGRAGLFTGSSTARTYLLGGTAMAFTLAIGAAVAVQPAGSIDRTAPALQRASASADELIPTTFVPANVTPTLRAASSDLPSIYANGCHVNLRDSTPPNCVYGDPTSKRTIVLFGDSHAAQFFPALNAAAKARRERLVVLTKSSCPSADLKVFNSYFLRNYDECDAFRAIALRRIAELNPEQVVLSNDTEYTPLTDPSMSRVAFEQVWAHALRRTIDLMPTTTQKVIISATPHFATSVPDCLSAHVADTNVCSEPLDPASARRDVTERAVVAAAPDATYIDATPWLCPDGVCSTIQGNVLMYEDSQHLTATYSAALGRYLGRALDDTSVG